MIKCKLAFSWILIGGITNLAHSARLFRTFWQPVRLFIRANGLRIRLKKLKSYIRAILNANVAALRKGDTYIGKTMVLHDGKVIDYGFFIDSSGEKPLVKKDGTLLKGASIVFAGASLMDDQIYIG